LYGVPTVFFEVLDDLLRRRVDDLHYSNDFLISWMK
jgi:hypothetical protein